jgi:hypothetical protein
MINGKEFSGFVGPVDDVFGNEFTTLVLPSKSALLEIYFFTDAHVKRVIIEINRNSADFEISLDDDKPMVKIIKKKSSYRTYIYIKVCYYFLRKYKRSK